MKDLYAILECSPSDGQELIKKNFRKLAQQFHPDKNPNDKYAHAKFREIKEAYEILISPQRKDIWLQERWLHQVMNKTTFESQPLTPLTIFYKILQWEKQMYFSDKFRYNYQSSRNQLENLLSEENIQCILSFNEPHLQKQILIHLTRGMKWIPYDITEKYNLCLFTIANGDPENIQLLNKLIQYKKKERFWNYWKFPIILLCTILICFFILFMSR